MRRRPLTVGANLENGADRAIACGPTGPEGTEKNVGLSWASCLRVARRRSVPSGVCGGKNSKLNVLEAMAHESDGQAKTPA